MEISIRNQGKGCGNLHGSEGWRNLGKEAKGGEGRNAPQLFYININICIFIDKKFVSTEYKIQYVFKSA